MKGLLGRILSPSGACLLILSVFIGSAKTVAAPATLKYEYDALGRLTFVEDNKNGNRDYDYDAAGNRTNVSVNGSSSQPLPPAIPVGLKLTGPFSPYGGGFHFSWNAVAGATSYQVRLKDGSYVYTTNTWADSAGPAADWVRAINDVGASDLAYF